VYVEVGKYKCICAAGFTGVNCDTDIDECTSKPCKNGGSCYTNSLQIDQYKCTCAGYRDVPVGTCGTEINECASDPCQHNSKCEAPAGSTKYKCTCTGGYSGTNCADNIDECDSTPCQNGATCTDDSNKFICTCSAGFAGKTCGGKVSVCTYLSGQVKCDKQRSICIDRPKLAKKHECKCNPGYSTTDGGETCANIQECASSPCKNGGTCKDGKCTFAACIEQFSCTCARGFAGEVCQLNVDECASYPCVNGGTCVYGTNKFTCVCNAGFTGDKCEKDIDECQSSPCQMGGTCIDSQHAAMKAKTSVGLGSTVNLQVRKTYFNSLANSVSGASADGVLSSDELIQDPEGAALLKQLQAQIAAELGIAASYVNVQGLKNTASGRRLQGTTSVEWGHILQKVAPDSYLCLCPAGFKGYNCEADINECASSPCLHGGTCTHGRGSYTCKCTSAYADVPTGTCYTERDECASDPCKNGGTCFDLVDKYMCVCSRGWTNSDCGQDSRRMSMTACPRHA